LFIQKKTNDANSIIFENQLENSFLNIHSLLNIWSLTLDHISTLRLVIRNCLVLKY